MFIIRSHESLKIIQNFHIGSFWTITLPLKLIYRKKASLLVTGAPLVLPDVLFTTALLTLSFELG
jgi:hypothetical protein